jgi:hypothetical protein
MTLEQLIQSLDLPIHVKRIAQIVIIQARDTLLSPTFAGDPDRELSRFLKVFSSLEPTSEDYYLVRDFIIRDLPQFEPSQFPR